MLNKDVLKAYFSQVFEKKTGTEQVHCRVPFNDCFWQYIGGKQYVIFRKLLTILPEKTVYLPVYFLFEILSNENSF